MDGFSAVRDWMPLLRPMLRILVILLAGWILLGFARRSIRVFESYMAGRAIDQEDHRRITTLAQVFRHTATLVVFLVAGMLALTELGLSIAPILGAAGVVGIAVGFGAQSLIKDYFNGFFLLIENQIHQGDVVEVGEKSGQVEEMTLRYLRLRDFEGNVHYVPNGLVTTVTNKSRGFAQSVIEVGIAYRESVDEAFEAMREVGAEMRDSEDFGGRILDDIEIVGVQEWADSAVILCCRFKVKPLEQWAVRREFLRRLKAAFDERGIEIPYPHLTIYAGVDKRGDAPAFRVLRENAE